MRDSLDGYVECLLQVTGDTAALNTFDKQFRSGTAPQWPDRAHDTAPRYSLNALFPVPEDILRRGYRTAGHLWCREYWETPDDLSQMRVKRLLGERSYQFFTLQSAPKNVFWKSSYEFPALHIKLALLGTEKGDFQIHSYHEGYYQGGYSPHGVDHFAALRQEMGFAA